MILLIKLPAPLKQKTTEQQPGEMQLQRRAHVKPVLFDARRLLAATKQLESRKGKARKLNLDA